MFATDAVYEVVPAAKAGPVPSDSPLSVASVEEEVVVVVEPVTTVPLMRINLDSLKEVQEPVLVLLRYNPLLAMLQPVAPPDSSLSDNVFRIALAESLALLTSTTTTYVLEAARSIPSPDAVNVLSPSSVRVAECVSVPTLLFGWPVSVLDQTLTVKVGRVQPKWRKI